MPKTVVLGANGFSGQDLVDLLLDDPDQEVIGVTRSPERSDLFLRYRLRPDLDRYRYFQLDVNHQMDELLELLDAERPEWIVNFAAQGQVAPSWEHPEHWFQTNCVALARLVNHLRRQGYVQRFLQISTPEIYGSSVGVVREDARLNPSTPYAASKAAADLLLSTYCKQFGFPLLIVRSTNVYGARQQLFRIIPRSVIYIKLGRKIPLHGGGLAIKSFIHIRDVSRGELAMLRQGRIGQTYHLSPDEGITVRDLVGRIAQKMGRSLDEVSTVVEARPGQDAAYVIDSSKARRQFGWRPEVSLEEGLAEVIDWVQQYWEQIVQQPLEYHHQP